MSNNNCSNCVSATVVTPPSPSSCLPDQGECCLEACNAIISCDDAVGPCGLNGSFDLTTLPHISTGCTGALSFVLEGHDDLLHSVSVSKAGILSWITPDSSSVGKYAEVYFRIICQSDCDGCITLSSIGSITIGIKDLCKAVVCESETETCDPCTGSCTDSELDVMVESEENINCIDGDC